MTDYVEHLVLCSDCGIPFDEMPESNGDWLIEEVAIRCPAGAPGCPGHILKSKIFCIPCGKKKGKARSDPTHSYS